jgi:predicted porin
MRQRWFLRHGHCCEAASSMSQPSFFQFFRSVRMFKKTVMAAAIAAVASAPAMAAEWKMNENTKFEVNVDVGAYYLDEDTGSENETMIKGEGLNQVEFKAKHKVNDDVTVFGEIEFEFDPIDNDSVDSDDIPVNYVWADDVKLGFSHKTLGQFMIGQFDSYYEDKVTEVLDIQFGENPIVSEPDSGDDGQHFQYLKKAGDLTFALDFNYVGEGDGGAADTNNDSDIGIAGAVVYKMGDLTLAAGMEDLNTYKITGAVDSKDKSKALAASYKMGNTKLHALFAKEDHDNGDTVDYQGLGIEHGIGSLDLAFAIQNVDETGEDKRTEWYAGAQYEMFTDMKVYIDMARFDKENNEDDQIEVGVKYSF